jgi:hypothetical protein
MSALQPGTRATGGREYAEEELGVPKGFLALSSAEGQGMAVVDFLRWCKSQAGDA